jgi:FKBP-type peptidyl-prolyl cis-trans isomerase SlyD
MVDKIQDGVVVTMAYRMVVEDEEIENATADDPMYYLHGSGAILPDLEDALLGKTVGDAIQVSVLMEPDIWEAEREEFDNLPDDIKVGDEIDIYDADGDMVRALVKEIDDQRVVLDLLDIDEWLVGKTAHFEVEVLALREASNEERAVGEPEEYFDLLDDDHDHDDE